MRMGLCMIDDSTNNMLMAIFHHNFQAATIEIKYRMLQDNISKLCSLYSWY